MTAPSTSEPRRIDRPEPGLFKVRLGKGTPWVPARIIRRASQPDRSPRLLCFVAGEEVYGLAEWWPRLHPVGEAEYRRLVNHMPADPRQAVDLASAPPLF